MPANLRAALNPTSIRFDKDAVERHAVYDDEADYFTSAAWLSELEAEELQKRDAARSVRKEGTR